MPEPRTPFHDLGNYVAIPRLTGLVLSPDGARLVASVQQLAASGDRYQTSLWEVDPAGVVEAHRLTHSEQGESGSAFVGDGSLLFTSNRPGPGDGAEAAEEPALWRLPQRGEAVRTATSAAGLYGPVGAQASRCTSSRRRGWPARPKRPTSSGAATAGTPRSRRSSTTDFPSGTGTASSARTSPGCSPPAPTTTRRPAISRPTPEPPWWRRSTLSHLDQAHATTDLTAWKLRLFGTPAEHPDWYAENSPHHFVDAITTPMLITHGNRDYRVPYSESLRLFWDLVRHHDGDPATLPHRFLQLPGENHWVLSPGNARIWNETVLAFLDWHVLGGEWTPPRLA